MSDNTPTENGSRKKGTGSESQVDFDVNAATHVVLDFGRHVKGVTRGRSEKEVSGFKRPDGL